MKWWSVIQAAFRDLASIGVGSYLLVKQAEVAKDHPESVNFFLIAAGVTLLGAPGMIGVFNLRRGNSALPDTPSPPSQHRPRSSSRR